MTQAIDTQHVWDQLGQSLRGYFARRLADAHAADDLVQETFLRIHRGLPKLDDAQRLGPWVFRIAHNVLVDHRRRAKPVGELSADPPDRLPDTDPPAEKAVGRCVRAMVEQLPQPYRDALDAVELEGQTQVAYAALTGLSVSGAKSRVQRGRRLLKRQLDACCVWQFDRRGNPMDWDQTNCRTDCGCRDDA